MFLESSATKFAFRSLKQRDWIKKWGPFISSNASFITYEDGREEKKILREDSTKEDALRAMAEIIFGKNMISANGPDYLKKILSDKSEIGQPAYDKLGILFNIENLRTLPLLWFEEEDGIWTTNDLGIANKVPVKNFVAIVIGDDVEEAKEFAKKTFSYRKEGEPEAKKKFEQSEREKNKGSEEEDEEDDDRRVDL